MKKLVTIQVELDVPEDTGQYVIEDYERSASLTSEGGEFGQIDAFGCMALDYIERGNRCIAHHYVKATAVIVLDLP